MERNLLALVRNGIDPRFIDSLGEKVAIGVIALKEPVKVIVEFAFQCVEVYGCFEQYFYIRNPGRVIWIHPG